MPQYAPVPWEAHGHNIIDSAGSTFAVLIRRGTTKISDVEPTAHLIAAAPVLLDAVFLLLSGDPDAEDFARNSIAMAEGRTIE